MNDGIFKNSNVNSQIHVQHFPYVLRHYFKCITCLKSKLLIFITTLGDYMGNLEAALCENQGDIQTMHNQKYIQSWRTYSKPSKAAFQSHYHSTVYPWSQNQDYHVAALNINPKSVTFSKHQVVA